MSDDKMQRDLNDYFHQQIQLRSGGKSQLEQEVAELISERTGKPRFVAENYSQSTRRHERFLWLFSPPLLLVWVVVLAVVIWLI